MFTFSTNCHSIPKINFNSTSISGFEDLWNLQIINDYTQPQVFALRILAYDENNRLLYNATSEEFLLQPGVFNTTKQSLSGVNVKFMTNEPVSSPADKEITVRIFLIDPVNNAEIYQYSERLKMEGQSISTIPDTAGEKKNSKFKKYVDFGGTLDLTGNYTNREDTLFYLPFDYFRLKLNSSLAIGGIPFTYDMYITTEQKYTSQKLNSYSFQFDYKTFKNNLVKKVSERMGKLFGNTTYINQFLNKPDNPFENYDTNSLLDSLKNRKILDASIIERYKEYTQLDSLKKALNITSDVEMKKYAHYLVSELQKIDTSKYDSLLAKLDKLDSLRSKADSLKAKADNYNATLKSFLDKGNAEYSKFYDQISKIDKYSLEDLGKLDKVEDFVRDKVYQFKYQDQLKRIQELKSLPGKDISSFMEDKDLRSVAQKYGLITKKEELLSGIKNLELGTVYPYYTYYSINGIILNGYNLAYQYRKFYIGSTGGKLLNIYSDSLTQGREMQKNNLFGFVLGYGNKNKTHLHVYYHYGTKKSEDTVTTHTTTIHNHVLTPELKLVFFKKRLNLNLEAPVSLTNSIEDTGLLTEVKRTGYAMKLNGFAQASEFTELNFSSAYVSKEYVSFGLPYLTSNFLESNIKITQKIKSYLQLSAGYKYENYFQDVDGDTSGTQLHTLTTGVLSQIKMLKINLSYAPGWMKNNLAAHTTYFSNLTAILSVGYKKKKVNYNNQLGFVYNTFFQNQLEIIDGGSVSIVNNFSELLKSMNIFSINSFSFDNKITVVENLSFVTNNFFHTQKEKMIILNFDFHHILSKKIKYTVSLQFNRVMMQNYKTMIQTSWDISINKYFMWHTKVQYDYLKGASRDRFYGNTHGILINSGIRLRI